VFKLHGFQNWGLSDYAYAGAGWQHFVIPIGEHFFEQDAYLTFVCDDDAGQTCDGWFWNLVLHTPPEAEFGGTPLLGVAPLAVTFTDFSTGAITDRLWDFGDGITSTLPSPTHTYGAAGVYTVTLTVSGPDGTDSAVKPGYVAVREPVSGTVNLNAHTLVSYGGAPQDRTPDKYEILDEGRALHLWGNTWKALALGFDVTPGAVIEFDFKSDADAGAVEIVGVGADATPGDIAANRVFKLHGSQNWGHADYAYAGAGWQHVVIPIGEHFAEQDAYLTFVCDDDAGQTCDGWFWNVVVHTSPGASSRRVNLKPMPLDGKGDDPALTAAAPSTNMPMQTTYRVDRAPTAASGGIITTTSYTICATVGQIDTFLRVGTGFSLRGGVWTTAAPTAHTCWAQLNDDPTEYYTVQAAVDASDDPDDVVKVAGYCAGVEARAGVTQTVYVSKTITIQGGYTTTNWTTSNPQANPTTLDAQGQGRVLYVTGDINPTIEGLRITGGDADGLGGYGVHDVGGGVYVVIATATISKTWVFNNIADYYGGGLFLRYSDATLSGNIISGNTAGEYGGGLSLWDSGATLSGNVVADNSSSDGGGLSLWESDATLSGNTVSGNSANRRGGGLLLYDSDATLTNNVVVDNQATDHGGGLLLYSSDATLNGNTVSDNISHFHGGGLHLWYGTVTLDGNVVSGNTTDDYGGGLYLHSSDATLTNNVIADNQAGINGSGVYVRSSSPRMLHTTIARNSGGDGSGIRVAESSTVALTNTILVNHTAGVVVESGSTATLESTLWHGNGTDWSGAGTINSNNDLTGDPAFVNPGASNYHIGPGSAAIDEGVDAGVEEDVDGEVRPQGAAPDLGADELFVLITSRVTTYVYDPLGRLVEADYSTGEQFEYAYDAVGNRETLTVAHESRVTHYEYDHANRLTKVGDTTYTWDERGNLTHDGTFTYTYNSAGRMVRAENVTTTLLYTYTADGLRVAQAVDGDVTTYAWDWASGLPEMLSDGEHLYLVGHDTLGHWGGGEWSYYLPDALGSVRQVADGAGSLVSSREWTPFGVEVGAAQAGLGYTGEWNDPYVNLTYLRARWYSPQYGIFLSRDPIESEPPYQYVRGNPINLVDPAGLCAIVGATDCEKFASEIRCMIEELRDARECHSWLKFDSEEAQVLDLLAWYYSGIPLNGLALGWWPRQTVLRRGDLDRWTVPRWNQQERPEFSWDHPINQPETELGQTMRQSYGFRRPYFEQTHHYFAFLKFAYHLGGPPVESVHWVLEIRDHLQPALDHIPELEQRGEPPSNIREWYAWIYRESVYDLYIVDEAVQLAFAISLFGVDVIPDCIESKWCANSEADVWSLENDVDRFYFSYPKKYWPDEQYWPGRR